MRNLEDFELDWIFGGAHSQCEEDDSPDASGDESRGEYPGDVEVYIDQEDPDP